MMFSHISPQYHVWLELGKDQHVECKTPGVHITKNPNFDPILTFS